LVVYPLSADNVSRPLPIRLKGINQPVIRTWNGFSRPRLTHLACIWTHVNHLTRRTSTAAVS